MALRVICRLRVFCNEGHDMSWPYVLFVDYEFFVIFPAIDIQFHNVYASGKMSQVYALINSGCMPAKVHVVYQLAR